MHDLILKHTLANALKYGKADGKAVLAKVFAENPEARKKAAEVVKMVGEEVFRVGGMDASEIEKQLRKLEPGMLHKPGKKVTVNEIPELKGAKKGKVIVRIPPEPNGFLHIGHGMAFTLNRLYAEKYEGKIVMKFEDSNPETAGLEYYSGILRDIKWLGIHWNELFVMSEHFGELEAGAEKLIKNGKAYVCTCKEDDIKKERMNKKAGPCRMRKKEENLSLWKAMKAGEPWVLRWKGDPESDNSVLRDPTLYRVIDKVHPWTGVNHLVYPTYDYGSAAADGLLGITHVLRSEEFLMRAPLHTEIIRSLGFKPPEYVHFGRFNLEGVPTSKRLIKPLVEGGKVHGWDDPRLSTLMGLRRRGILPKTLEELVKNSGTDRGASLIDHNILHSINRKLLDPVSERYFVVREPVKLKLEGVPEGRKAHLEKIPGNKDAGFREFTVGDCVFLEKSDYEANKGKVVRLKGLYNVKLDGKKATYAGEEIVRPIIHWVSLPIEGELLMIEEHAGAGDGELPEKMKSEKVLAENGITFSNSITIQMERLGFARIEGRRPLKLVFISK